MEKIEELVERIKSDVASLSYELEVLSRKPVTSKEKAEFAALRIWNIAYDTGLQDGREGHYKRPPPNATELAKEVGLLEREAK